MSKSKGNVVTPMAMLEEYGSDGVRYWAARGGPGVDTAFDVGQMKIGRKLAMKLLNVSKFVLAGEQPDGPVTEALDRGMLMSLAALVADATAELERYEYAKALAKVESVLLGLLRQLHRVGEVAPLRRLRPRGGGLGVDRDAAGAVGDAAAAGAVPGVHLRGRVVVVADRVDSPRRLADARRSAGRVRRGRARRSRRTPCSPTRSAPSARARRIRRCRSAREVLSVAYSGPDDEIRALRAGRARPEGRRAHRDADAVGRASPPSTVALKPAEA